MRNNQWYENNKDRILELYYEPKTVTEICSILQCNRSMIYRKFKEWNIDKRAKIPSPERCNAKYKINTHYFDNINTEHKAYWLGFLLADGYVNQKEILLCLQKEDEYLINKFKEDLEAEQPIKYDSYDNPIITIICKQLCQRLYNIGFHNRKSWSIDLDKILKSIPSDLENHFIRGLFDGDGCIKYYQYSYIKNPQFHFGITGVKNVCEYIKDKFKIDRKLVFEGNKTYTVVTRNITIILNIFDYLYKDATIYLDRKYKTFKEIQMITFNDYNKAIS